VNVLGMRDWLEVLFPLDLSPPLAVYLQFSSADANTSRARFFLVDRLILGFISSLSTTEVFL